MQFQEKEKDKNTLRKKSYKVLLDWADEGFCEIELPIHSNAPLDYKSIEINKAFDQQSSLHNVNRKMVLRNLTSNAIKFTTPNEKITISDMLKENEPELSVLGTGIENKQNNRGKCFKLIKISHL